MAQIFDPSFDIDNDGEFFWHATSVKNVLDMIKYDAGGLKPIGNGQLGAGFYLTGARSDYQKQMAKRTIASTDEPLFMFYVGVKGFYKLRPRFLTQWNTTTADEDFSAVSWYTGNNQGAVGAEERGGFIPSTQRNVARQNFKYGEYQQERMFGTDIATQSDREKTSFMQLLWNYAQANGRPPYNEVAGFGPLGATAAILGARAVFKRVLLELAIKNAMCLANSAIAGVKVFSPSTGSVPLGFTFAGKKYDIKEAVIESTALKADEDPMNFHDEVWLDLATLVQKLKN